MIPPGRQIGKIWGWSLLALAYPIMIHTTDPWIALSYILFIVGLNVT